MILSFEFLMCSYALFNCVYSLENEFVVGILEDGIDYSLQNIVLRVI